MGIVVAEAELAERATTFIRGEMKLAKVTYEGMEERLKEHGLSETRDLLAAKLKRGTFAATFLLACLAALDLEGLRVKDL